MSNVIRGALHHITDWRATVRDHFAGDRPPVVGWALPFLGCGVSYYRGGPRWLREQHRRLGSPFTLYMMGRRFTVGHDPEFMQHFYNAEVADVSFFAGLEAFAGLGDLVPLGLTGPEEDNLGTDLLRRFLPGKITGSGAELDAEARASLHECLASGHADVLTLMRRTILRFTALLLVGERLTHDPRFVDRICAFDEALFKVTRNPFDARRVQAGLRVREAVLTMLRSELGRRRTAGFDDPPRDFLDAFARLLGPDGRPFSDEIITLDLNSMLWATAANTPAGATICLTHILRDPALHRRVVAEVDAAAAAHDDVLDASAQKAMPLLQASYLEALRLYAPPLHIRKAMTPVTIGGREIAAGSLIAFSPYILHRDPTVYSDPEVFDPDRFLTGPRGPGKSPPASHYVPFGRGLHACIGRNLARQEIVLSIARLLRDFEVTLEGLDRPLTIDWLTTGIALPGEPQRLRVRPRG